MTDRVNKDLLAHFEHSQRMRAKKLSKSDFLKVTFNPPFFGGHTEPNGLLSRDKEDQALWYYYCLASAGMSRVQNDLVYEGEPDIDPKYERHFKNCAMMYGVDVETMANRWPRIEAEIVRVNALRVAAGDQPFTLLPLRYKFANTAYSIVGGKDKS